MWRIPWQIREWQHRTSERILTGVVWRLPHSLVYWCGIRLWANATMGHYGNTVATDVTMDETLHRWGNPR